MNWRKTTVTNVAWTDINQYMEENCLKHFEWYGQEKDVYYLGRDSIFTTEAKRLNRQLGLHKINKQWEKK